MNHCSEICHWLWLWWHILHQPYLIRATEAEIDASGYYPVGNHRILYTFEDRCGNQISEFHDFEIKICKAPIASCINGTSISLQPMTINGQNLRMACITAASLNVSTVIHVMLRFLLHSQQMLTIPLSVLTVQTLVGYPAVVCNWHLWKLFNMRNLHRRSKQWWIIYSDQCYKWEICNGQSTTLTVSGSTGSIVWNLGATTPSITVNPATTSTFSVSVTSLGWLYFIGLQDHCSWSPNQMRASASLPLVQPFVLASLQHWRQQVEVLTVGVQGPIQLQ